MNRSFKARNTWIIIIFLIVASINNQCGSQSFGLRADSLFLYTENSEIIYDLKKPAQKFFLPYVLSEISGLSFKSPNKLLAVDDETGKVFEYDIDNKKIVHSMEFSKPGDYEGVELIGDQVYVLESDGDLYTFTYSPSKKMEANKIENDLERSNDTEGLGYYPPMNQLLIACKDKATVKGNDAKGRAVYSFDLQTQDLSRDPIFTIRSKDLESFWEEKKDFEYEADRIKFKPSAIAYHPIENVLYVLASTGKLLIVIDRDGSIKATYPISARVLSQPEGLCFAPNGDMYISSEGEGDRGYVLKFPMNKK